MEDNWDRRSELVKLDLGTINEMLRSVLGRHKVVAATILASGHVNTNYKLQVEDSEEALVLRVHTRDQHSCQKEFSLFKAVGEIVPMAEILYIEPTPSNFGFAYSVLKWVDGVLLDSVITSEDSSLVSQVARDIGGKLAAIGSYRFAQPGLLDQNLELEVPFTTTAESWLSFIQRCLFEGHASQQLGEEWTAQLWQYVNENVSQLAALTQESLLVHGDFKGSNILVREEVEGWRVAAVLDWEFAYAGSFLSDIGTLLRYNRRFNPVFESSFIAGFEQQGGKLPNEWKRTAGLLDLLNLCDFLNRPHGNEVMRQEVTQLIINTLKS